MTRNRSAGLWLAVVACGLLAAEAPAQEAPRLRIDLQVAKEIVQEESSGGVQVRREPAEAVGGVRRGVAKTAGSRSLTALSGAGRIVLACVHGRGCMVV